MVAVERTEHIAVNVFLEPFDILVDGGSLLPNRQSEGEGERPV